METLKIVTLNCWGIPIPGISKMRSLRIAAIAQELKKGDYHVAVLEEIWSKADYDYLYSEVFDTMRYSHYFFSGAIGSGVCVFSKMQISETFFHRFHLNGQVYKIQHGDWFGGKGVGLCKFDFQGFKINLYVTHIHAEYNRFKDEYLPHRMSQAFELSQFIRHTSAECDVVVAAGDFNLEHTDVAYNLILTNTPLRDAWNNKKNIPETNRIGATCECPWNRFRDPSVEDMYPDGKRIDYIMYCGQSGVQVSVEKCYTTLGQVPGQDFPFSDHEGVAAELKFSRNTSVTDEVKSPQDRPDENIIYLRTACEVVNSGMRQVQRSMNRFQLQALGLAVLLYWLCYTDVAHSNPQPIPFFMGVAKFVLVVVIAVLVWLSLVVKRGEMQGLLATKLDIDKLLAEKVKSE